MTTSWIKFGKNGGTGISTAKRPGICQGAIIDHGKRVSETDAGGKRSDKLKEWNRQVPISSRAMKFSSMIIEDADHTDAINSFWSSVGCEEITPGRCSVLLIAELYARTMLKGDLDPARVIDEILALEGIKNSCTKPAQPLRRDLEGLHHKHYREPGIQSLVINLDNEAKRYEYRLSDESKRILEGETNREKQYWMIASAAAQVFTHDNLRRRMSESRMTGEWIVYAIYQGKNYYLCLGKHDDGDEAIRSKIVETCLIEYPFLRKVIRETDEQG